MEPEISNQVRCSRCQRAPRDDYDYVGWEVLDEGVVCPGCLTMLELENAPSDGVTIREHTAMHATTTDREEPHDDQGQEHEEEHG